MVSIPGIAYLIIGIAMALYSKFISRITGSENAVMDIFFYIGILLVVVGVIKLILKFLSREKKHEPKEDHKHHETPTHHEMHKPEMHYQGHAHQHAHKEHPHHTIIYCSGCGAKNYSTSNFCHKCGKPLH